MGRAIYLSQKPTTQPLVIFIQTNKHNPNGWIEKSNGKTIKLKHVKHRQN